MNAQTKINLDREITRRLRDTTEKTATALQQQLEESKARLALGTFLLFTLVGVSVSHIFIGGYVTFLLGTEGFL